MERVSCVAGKPEGRYGSPALAPWESGAESPTQGSPIQYNREEKGSPCGIRQWESVVFGLPRSLRPYHHRQRAIVLSQHQPGKFTPICVGGALWQNWGLAEGSDWYT